MTQDTNSPQFGEGPSGLEPELGGAFRNADLVPCGVSLPTISLSRGDGEQGRWGAKNGSLIRAKLN
jgi:hypothetical protein